MVIVKINALTDHMRIVVPKQASSIKDIYCGMYLLLPMLDTCFWHNTPRVFL